MYIADKYIKQLSNLKAKTVIMWKRMVKNQVETDGEFNNTSKIFNPLRPTVKFSQR